MKGKQLAAGVALVVVLAALAGCQSWTGLSGAKQRHGCAAPDGVYCMSTSGVYANSISGTLPLPATAKHLENGERYALTTPSTVRVTPGVGTAIRSDPRVLRVWVAPWEDADGDLHDHMYVYMTVDNGRWLVEHNRRRTGSREGITPYQARPQAQGEAAAPAVPTPAYSPFAQPAIPAPEGAR
jgi:conjugal transfer pilus assembly protein TraV